MGPIREHVLCAVCRGKLAPSGTCHGYTSAMNSILNECRPRNSTDICSTVIHVTRSFSLECPLVSNRNGFNGVSNCPTTTCHCARSHVGELSLSVLSSVSGRAISFDPGCSGHLARPGILPIHFPRLLIGNSDNVTINVTARVPPRGLNRIVSNVYYLVSGPRTRLRSVYRCVGKPSFPANNVVVNHTNVHTTCTANENGVIIHNGTRVRRRGGNGFEVIVARVPCGIGGRRLIGGVCSLTTSGGVRNVSSIISCSDGHSNNVEVVISLGGSTGPRIILGGLCGGATLRAAFNTVLLTVIGKGPGVLALGRVLRGYVSFRYSVVAHHATCRGHGTRRHTRVLRKLGVTLSFVSRIVGVVHTDGSVPRDGRTLVREFGLSSVRTATVIRVRLNGLSNLRGRGVLSRLTRGLRFVGRYRTVLTSRRHVLSVIGARTLGLHSGCSSSHEDRVSSILNRISVRSLVPRRRYILAGAIGNCVGHLPTSACGIRGHNNENVANVAAERSSVIRGVFMYSSRSCMVLFSGFNEVCHVGTCRVPRNDHASGNVGVIGVIPLVTNRGVAIVLPTDSLSRRGCVTVMAGGNAVGHAGISRFEGAHGDNVVTVSVSSSSRLTFMEVASNGRGLFITAGGNLTVRFGRAKIHTVKHGTHNIGTVGVHSNSRIISVTMARRGAGVLAVARANCKHVDPVDSCHVRAENNGKLAGCHARGCNYITTAVPMANRRSVVVVTSGNVVVHVFTNSVSAFDHPTGNMEIVHITRNRGVLSINLTRRGRTRMGSGPRRTSTSTNAISTTTVRTRGGTTSRRIIRGRRGWATTGFWGVIVFPCRQGL